MGNNVGGGQQTAYTPQGQGGGLITNDYAAPPQMQGNPQGIPLQGMPQQAQGIPAAPQMSSAPQMPVVPQTPIQAQGVPPGGSPQGYRPMPSQAQGVPQRPAMPQGGPPQGMPPQGMPPQGRPDNNGQKQRMLAQQMRNRPR